MARLKRSIPVLVGPVRTRRGLSRRAIVKGRVPWATSTTSYYDRLRQGRPAAIHSSRGKLTERHEARRSSVIVDEVSESD
jgi:hypothetical protein